MAEAGKKESFTSNKFLGGIIVVLAVIVIFFAFNQENISTNPLVVLPEAEETGLTPIYEKNQVEITPSSYAVRQQYFEEAFKPKRDEYDLFEKAAARLQIPLEYVPEYFALNSEKDIFNELPPVPNDFSEVAYLLATGRNYALGPITEEYFLQPEFYPNFKENGLKYWSEPDPKYWATNGYGSYPAEQFDVLSQSGRTEFYSVVFFYTGYGVQTYQGAHLIPTSNTLKYFDVDISPDTFLLTPTFPKFSKDWVYKITIQGKVKPDTPAGEYTIGFLIVDPPIEKRNEWAGEYRNLYFNAATVISPSNFPITFNITVEE